MDAGLILTLLKSNLGMGTTFRDEYLTKLIEGILAELEKEKGIVLNPADAGHLMFVVDLAAWRFTARDTTENMPKHLTYRMKCLFLHSGGAASV